MKNAQQAKQSPITWQDNPAWYAALSLTERIASLQGDQLPASSEQKTPAEKVARRLQAWKKQLAKEALFADRLAQDAITEEDLAFLLAESLDSIQSRHLQLFSMPDWLVQLSTAFKDEGTDEVTQLFQDAMMKQAHALYLQPIFPLLRHGLHQLQAGIQILGQRFPSLPFDPQQIAPVLFTQVLEQLLAQLSKTFVLEMHVARLQNRLTGDTAAERFNDFVRQLSQKGKILPLLEEYPVLARQLVLTIDRWVNYAQEFLTHLCTDWHDICLTFTPDRNPGQLVAVHGGAGDVHRNGRSVLVLKFSSGFQLLYKPKSLAIDVHFQELLAWLNTQGNQSAFRTISVLDRGRYGWSEFVPNQSCTSQEEVARFYERQGGYLALLYALDATDIHAENVIAAGEHPILVDLEALFHPRVGGEDLTQLYNLGLLSMDHSVFRVGLLPHRIWSTQEGVGVDLSGLGGQSGQMTPRPLPGWDQTGTDQMRLIRQRREIPVKQNRPSLNGQDIDMLDYSHYLIAGFINVYRLLQTRRDEFMTDILPRFAHDEIRSLIRPSQRYANLLMESYHPDLLRDALERDRFFDHLWYEVEFRPYFSRVIPAERCDLLRGDIPLFTTYPDSRTIFTSDGETIEDFFDVSSLELVKQRLQQLDESDMARQIWVIEAALATLSMNPEQKTGHTSLIAAGSPSSPASHERLMTAARAIGDRLDKLAVRNEHGACWLGVSVVNDTSWSVLPTDIDLYNGTSGIALFLGYLGALTGEERYVTLVRLALATIRSRVEQEKKYQQSSRLGAFDGLSSVICLLTHLSVLWKDSALIQEAEALVELLPPLIQADEHLDIIAGSAGCIMALLSLYAVSPSKRTLDVACQCGEHLLATAQRMTEGIAWTTIKHEKPLGGFAHGASGILLSLLALAHASGEERYSHAAIAALAYDRSLFVPEQQNWADLRAFSKLLANPEQPDASKNAEEPTYMVAWCYGAPGIGLGRLGALQYLDDATIRQEIEIALQTTTAKGMNDNHSLCHGALGNLELLQTAVQVLADTRYQDPLARQTALILDSIDNAGLVTGVPLGVETPGLMTGIAGIGYELLRLAEPDRVPSVLLLGAPVL